jgi:hypothetical protein
MDSGNKKGQILAKSEDTVNANFTEPSALRAAKWHYLQCRELPLLFFYQYILVWFYWKKKWFSVPILLMNSE